MLSRDPESQDPGRFSQSRIPGLAKPKSRNFGIEKIVFFSWNQHIFHDICYKLEKKLFSHTLTVTLLSTPAAMLQVATAFFHSWLTRPIATNERYQSWDGIIWQYWETRLLFGDKCTRTYWLSHQHRWKLKAKTLFPRRKFSQLNCDHDLVIIQSTLCFLRSFCLRAKPKCNYKPLGSPDCCSLFSGLILLVNWGTFNFELIKFIKTTENTISA